MVAPENLYSVKASILFVATQKTVQEIRASDSPMKWAAWFLLFYPLAAPFYAYTRRNWSVLLNTLASIFAISILWEVLKIFIKTVWSYDIDSNSLLDLLFTLMVWVAIAIVGHKSILAVVTSARSDLAKDVVRNPASLPENSSIPPQFTRSQRSVSMALSSFSRLLRSKKRLSYGLGALLVVVIGAYALYTSTVESTIKSNPVLAAVSATGTTVRIKHFNCGNLYGYYDSASNTMEICTAVHDNQLFSSKESTIRHEAWHLVQACSAVKSKDDEWGEFVEVNTPLLNGKTLNDEELNYISENYDQQSQSIEKEAFLAEFNLTDGQIISAIEEKCYFPA